MKSRRIAVITLVMILIGVLFSGCGQKAAPDVHVFEGRVCTGDQFVSSKEQKEKILSDFGGLCCKMEGGAIAQVCYLSQTPYVIIRAISDKADESESVNYEIFKEEAAANCARIVQYMIEEMLTSG